MKIAIIEDEQVHAELLGRYLNNWSEKKKVALEIKYYPSAENFLFEWETGQDFSALFVDIQMKKMNGMQMAKSVREKDGKINIIFTTGIRDYIEEGYEVEAMHYLLKPIREGKVAACMDKIVEKSGETQYLLVHTKEELHKFEVDSVNYIEARGHGCVIEVVGQGEQRGQTDLYEVKEGITELENQVIYHGFVKCHRSYLCGIRNIHHIGRTEIVFDNGSRIPVSRRLHREVNQAFIKYFKKGDKCE